MQGDDCSGVEDEVRWASMVSAVRDAYRSPTLAGVGAPEADARTRAGAVPAGHPGRTSAVQSLLRAAHSPAVRPDQSSTGGLRRAGPGALLRPAARPLLRVAGPTPVSWEP
ncbi:hypothetical protein Y032_0252g208 [Ancylostoma ceylanicum]|uniref:Uncharacterized protein n=1 Tax=Ancylostoma ceylanicum TaxID=53326 RepID=A0A016SCU6_9BILA|nr:hypothetical protein Y032_0252g208 [Ancylostoma ceylanicum]